MLCSRSQMSSTKPRANQALVPGAVLVGGRRRRCTPTIANRSITITSSRISPSASTRSWRTWRRLGTGRRQGSAREDHPGRTGRHRDRRASAASQPTAGEHGDRGGRQAACHTDRGGDPEDQGMACSEPQPDPATTSISRRSRTASDSTRRPPCCEASTTTTPTSTAGRRPSPRNSSDSWRTRARETPRSPTQLASYKALDPRWHEWSTVKAVLAELAERMVR